MRTVHYAALILLLVTGACHSGINYPDPVGPRYSGALLRPRPAAMWRDTLLVVSFNIKNAQKVDSAVVMLTAEPDVQNADIVLLQEVDETSARRVAQALAMGFVYYPARQRASTRRDFGNAVLSRWPMADDKKLVLPHLSIFGGTQRIATAVTVQVGSMPIRVYSVHLATPVNLALRDRQDQMSTILRDAAPHPHVIIGGDMNSSGLGKVAREQGFAWPTREGPRTVPIGRVDHIFFKGLVPPDNGASGTVLNNHGASDHLAVWARGVVY